MKVFLPLAGFVLGSALFIGVNTANAQEGGVTLVDKISERFGVSQEEAQQVIDEYHSEKKAEREQMVEDHLQSKVDDGTITAEQKDALLAKLDEIKAQREQAKEDGLSREEAKETFKGLKEELKTWAEDNGITLEEVMPERKGHRGPGGHKPYSQE